MIRRAWRWLARWLTRHTEAEKLARAAREHELQDEYRKNVWPFTR